MAHEPRTVKPLTTFVTPSEVPTRTPSGQRIVTPLRLAEADLPKDAPVAEPTPEVAPPSEVTVGVKEEVLAEDRVEVTHEPVVEENPITSETDPETIEKDAEEVGENRTSKPKRPRPTPTPIKVPGDASTAAGGSAAKKGGRSTS